MIMNKKLRKTLFILGSLAIVVAICVVCFIIGRGHTLYFDNKTTEDEAYHYYDAIDLYYKGDKVTTLNARERISISFTGQSVEVTLKYRKGKNETKKEETVTFTVPYDMDGIVVNLPAYLDGADQSTYMSEFVSLAVVVDSGTETEEIVTDEFGVSATEE